MPRPGASQGYARQSSSGWLVVVAPLADFSRQIAASSAAQPKFDGFNNPRCGASIAKWIGRALHPPVFDRVVQQPPYLGNDLRARRSDQLGGAHLDDFGPLCHIAQNEERFSERGRLLLDAA